MARDLVDRLLAASGAADESVHAAVFAAFEALSAEIDLNALARRRPRLVPARRSPARRRVLVIRLSALGDFVQSLGPFAAIRRRHAGDHVALLTTAPFASFAAGLGCFDEVLIDPRPRPAALKDWWALRRQLRRGGFDRVYDLQTSQRSSSYLRLFARHVRPEWSGIAPGSSHPHANLDRDRQHTIDKQAEQVLMAGVHPTPLPQLPAAFGEIPDDLAGREFVVLVPGSSPHRPTKRWPAARYGELARRLAELGYLAVVVGTEEERPLAAEGVRELGFVPDEELAGLYRGASVFAYPSRFEGFGMPVVEALASGVPTVVSSHPSLDEASGEAALRADPDDAEAFAEALERALDGDTARRAAGLAHAARFTRQACGEAVLAGYEKALKD